MATNTRLKAAREGKGFTRSQLAGIIGKKTIDISRSETEHSYPDRNVELEAIPIQNGDSAQTTLCRRLLRAGLLIFAVACVSLCLGCIEGSITLRGTVDMGDCQADVDLVLVPSKNGQ